ncbi:hypothetical protein [Paenibacillus sp. SI8]|uniref:hypothetical protein n=1 Tax=unclassified Paenibacillus TaxID=185978 RepID=UPI003467DD36
MPPQPLPDWMKPALDERFNELAQIVSKLDEAVLLHDKQVEVEQQLKQELISMQFQLILEWEETLNYRHTMALEWMYHAGLKDGIQMARIFYSQ